MPEVSIGFFPDVGATWFLPRLPGELGAYCALTGERLNAADGVAATIATHRVTSSRFADLADALCGAVSVDATLAAFAEPAGEGKLARRRGAIDRLFKGDRVENILAALDAERGDDAEFAKATAATIRAKSPTSLKLALAQMRAGATLSFQACMQTEFRIVSRVIHGHDFYEGVRAVIVDKDNAPKWRPASAGRRLGCRDRAPFRAAARRRMDGPVSDQNAASTTKAPQPVSPLQQAANAIKPPAPIRSAISSRCMPTSRKSTRRAGPGAWSSSFA